MGKSTSFDNSLLLLIFNGNNIANLADNAASPITSLFLSLHTADPSSGNQNTSEIVYTSYNRVAVSRNSAGWTVTGANAVNANNIAFPQCTGGNNTAAFFAIGKNNTGTAGQLYYVGALNSNLIVTNGITPTFAPGTAIVSEA